MSIEKVALIAKPDSGQMYAKFRSTCIKLIRPTVFLHTGPTMAWSHITDPEQTRTRPGPGLPKPAPHLAQIQNPNLPCQNTTGTDIDEDMYKSHFQICKATFRSNIYFLLKMCTNKLCLSINSNNDIKLLQVKCHLLII